MRTGLLIAIVFLYAFYLAPQNGSSAYEKIVALARKFPEKTEVAIGILQEGKRTYVGFRKTNRRLILVKNADRVFGIASLTKLFTCALVADLVNAKKISLQDNIQKFYPFKIRYSGNVPPVTIAGLCTHSSGLPADAGMGVESFLRSKVYLSFDGGKYRYSNLGFMILGDIVERVTGKNYRDLLQEKILGPLKMKDTGIDLMNVDKDQLAEARDANGNKLPVRVSYAYEGVGSIKSSAADMLNFIEYSFQKRSSVSNDLKLMQKTLFQKNRSESMGMGWKIAHKGKDNIYYHDGKLAGYTAEIRYSTLRKRGVIVLSNVSGMGPYSEHIALIAEACLKD